MPLVDGGQEFTTAKGTPGTYNVQIFAIFTGFDQMVGTVIGFSSAASASAAHRRPPQRRASCRCMPVLLRTTLTALHPDATVATPPRCASLAASSLLRLTRASPPHQRPASTTGSVDGAAFGPRSAVDPGSPRRRQRCRRARRASTARGALPLPVHRGSRLSHPLPVEGPTLLRAFVKYPIFRRAQLQLRPIGPAARCSGPPTAAHAEPANAAARSSPKSSRMRCWRARSARRSSGRMDEHFPARRSPIRRHHLRPPCSASR